MRICLFGGSQKTIQFSFFNLSIKKDLANILESMGSGLVSGHRPSRSWGTWSKRWSLRVCRRRGRPKLALCRYGRTRLVRTIHLRTACAMFGHLLAGNGRTSRSISICRRRSHQRCRTVHVRRRCIKLRRFWQWWPRHWRRCRHWRP